MIGIGAANVAAGLFQGFPVSTSGSRTAVAEQAGAKTQVAGVVGAVAITLILVFVPGLLREPPAADARGGRDRRVALPRRHPRHDPALASSGGPSSALCTAAFLGVALLGVLPGIAIAVALSILNVFRRSWWPYQATLGRVEGLAGLHDVTSYPEAERIDGLVIFRFDAPLIFANTRTFREQITEMADDIPGLRWIVVAAEPITDVDTTAADMLEDLDEALNARGISLVFAEMKDPVRRKIERYELTRTIDPTHFYPTLDAAVRAFQAETGATWRPPEQEATDDDRH